MFNICFSYKNVKLFTMKNIVQQLQEQHYAIVEVDEQLHSIIVRYQELWARFVSLPLSEKQKIKYIDGTGYEFKQGTTFDEKDNFHFRISQLFRMLDDAEGDNIKLRNILNEFFLLGTHLIWYYKDFLYRNIYLDFSSIVKEEVLRRFFNSYREWILRSLFYHPKQEVEVDVADAHPDKGFITMASYSSCPGLQYFDVTTQKWKDVVLKENEIFIMLGLQGQYVTNSKVKALYHRAVNHPETIEKGRYAQVGFLDIGFGTPKYNKKKHGSTQLKPLAFNYNVSHEEFLKEYL
jgi:hypothetical protein